MENSLIAQKLRSFDYYYRKLPMYLQQSYGFSSHFRLWFDAMMGQNIEQTFNGIVPSFETMFYLINIFDSDGTGISAYLKNIIKIPDANVSDAHPYGTVCYMLDDIGALFGVRRKFSLEYFDGVQNVKAELNLDNAEFLILIKAMIVKNYCEGTYEQLVEFYRSVGLFVVMTTSMPATCNVYIATATEGSVYSYTENVKAMFLSGLLLIKSMGIQYNTSFIDMTKLLTWHTEGSSELIGWGPEVENSNIKAGEWTI